MIVKTLTIIMTAYNAMPFIEQAVESILAQTFENYNFLIINDGSTDGSQSYLNSLKDPRISVINLKKNVGRVAALNLALQEAKDDWLLMMDADDLALPQLIEKEVLFLERHPHYCLVSCGWGYIGVNGRPLKATQIPLLKSPPSFDPTLDAYIRNSGSLFLRRPVIEVGGYRDVLAEDWDLWVRLNEASYKMACIPEILLLYRTLPDSRSTKNFILHRLSKEYSLVCSLARRKGQKEPCQINFYTEHWPRGWRFLKIEGERQFRLAGAAWGSGRYWEAQARFLLSLVLIPTMVISKLRLYFWQKKGLINNTYDS